VASQPDHLPDLAGQAQRTLRNGRRIVHRGHFDRRQRTGGEFIDVPAGFHTAKIGGLKQRVVNQVDHKFPRLHDLLMRMARRPDGNRNHRRFRTDRTRPGDGDQVGARSLTGRQTAAGNQGNRDRR